MQDINEQSLDKSWQVVCKATSCSMRCERSSTFCLRPPSSVRGLERGANRSRSQSRGGQAKRFNEVSPKSVWTGPWSVTHWLMWWQVVSRERTRDGVWHWEDCAKMASIHIKLYDSGEYPTSNSVSFFCFVEWLWLHFQVDTRNFETTLNPQNNKAIISLF